MLIKVLLNRAGQLSVQNHAIGKTTTSRLVPTGSTWHHLSLHVVVAGASSRIDVSLDDPATPQIQRTDSLGTTPVGRLELGETAKGRTFSVAFDDVIADVPAQGTNPPAAPGDLSMTSISSSSVDLSWTAAQDDTGVAGYTIYRADPGGQFAP